MSFSDHSEPANIREAELKSAHDVACDLAFLLRDNERLGAAFVDLEEKVRAVIFWKTDPVDLDNR